MDADAESRADMPASDAERRQLTVMFCDLVGSTQLSQELDPEDLREVMRRYQDAVSGAVARYGGHVAKFLGDGVLAYFGWPQAYEDQAERAVRTGLDAVAAVQTVRLGERILRARIGIATGQVVVGDLVGTAATDAQAITGETPNLAARLQGIADAGQVVIGVATRLLVGKTFELDALGRHELKGFSSTVPAWAVTGESAVESRFEASHAGALARLVGREHELGLLLARWELAKNGESQVMLLSGEAGIGKSRMLRGLRDAIEGERHFHLRYQCTPHHTNSAFYPIIQRLERAAGFLAEDAGETRLDKLEALLKPTADDVQSVAPLFAALLSLPGEDRYGPLDLTPQHLRDRTVVALIEQILALSRQRPVLFAFEDAHWIDPSTEVLIGEIMSRMADAAVFMLITHRPEYMPPWTRHSHETSMTLSRLSRSQGAEIVADIGGGDLSQSMIDRIIARADGIPLYVEELAKSVAESEKDDQNLDEHIPETLQASLIARLDRLGDAKKIAQVGAVIGREFAYSLLANVVQTPAVELEELLSNLVRSELVFQRGSPPEAVYIFKHALVQDSAYDSLLRSARQRIHGEVAHTLRRAFQSVADSEPELLAHHFAVAGDVETAIDFYIKAGQAAAATCAYSEAETHLKKGLAMTPTLAGPGAMEKELTLQTSLGPIVMATKGYASKEAQEAYQRADELCQIIDDPHRQFQVLIGLRYIFGVGGAYQGALDAGNRAVDLAEQLGGPIHVAQAHSSLAHTLCCIGDYSGAKEHIDRALDAYEPAQHADHVKLSGLDPGIFGLGTAAWVYWFLGYPDQALCFAEKGIAIASDFDNPQSREQAFRACAITQLLRREHDAALKNAEAANSISQENGLRQPEAMVQVPRGWALTMGGDGDQAIERIRRGLKDILATGAKAQWTYFIGTLAQCCLHDDRLEEGLLVVDEAISNILDRDDRIWEAEIYRLKGEFLHKRGDAAAEIELYFQKALDAARTQSAKSWELRAATSLARLWQGQEKNKEARDLLQPVYDWFTEGFDTPDLIDAKALSDELS